MKAFFFFLTDHKSRIVTRLEPLFAFLHLLLSVPAEILFFRPAPAAEDCSRGTLDCAASVVVFHVERQRSSLCVGGFLELS